MIKRKLFFCNYQLGTLDYLLGGAVLLFLFLGFYEPDILITGKNTLNYFFGNLSEFYENCKKINGIEFANYPPTLYAIFALWLYPFFNPFKLYSSNVYFTMFIGYLLLQMVIKFNIIQYSTFPSSNLYSYWQVRINYYIGISIFLVPAILALYTNN